MEGWNRKWEKYDPYAIFRYAFIDGQLVINDGDSPWVSRQAALYENKALYDDLNPLHKEMLKSLADRGLLSCYLTRVPYPCQSDNICKQRGIKSKKMLKDPPNNLHIAYGGINSINSDLNTSNTDVVGARYSFPSKGTMLLAPNKDSVTIDATNKNSAEHASIALLVTLVIGILVFLISMSICINSLVIRKKYNANKILLEKNANNLSAS